MSKENSEKLFWKKIQECKEKNIEKFDYSYVTSENYPDRKTRDTIIKIKCIKHDTWFHQKIGLHHAGYNACPCCIKEQRVSNGKKNHLVKGNDWSVLNKEVQEYLNKGMSRDKIAEIYGVSTSIIRTVIRKYNLKFTNFHILNRKVLFEKIIDMIKSGEGKSILDISHKLHTTSTLIRDILKDNGIDVDNKDTRNLLFGIDYSWKKILTPQVITDFILNNQKETLASIASRYKIPQTTFFSYVNSIGIDYNSLLSKREENLANSIKNLAENKLFSKKQIGIELGIGYKMITNLSKKYNIKYITVNHHSSGEYKFYKYYKDNLQNDYEIIPQYKITDIPGRRKNLIFVDYKLINKKTTKIILVEINGEQHYKYQTGVRFHEDIDEFYQQVRRDVNLRNYCKDNLIDFIEIPYTVWNNMYEFLDKLFKENSKYEDMISIESLYERPIEEILKEIK